MRGAALGTVPWGRAEAPAALEAAWGWEGAPRTCRARPVGAQRCWAGGGAGDKRPPGSPCRVSPGPREAGRQARPCPWPAGDRTGAARAQPLLLEVCVGGGDSQAAQQLRPETVECSFPPGSERRSVPRSRASPSQGPCALGPFACGPALAAGAEPEPGLGSDSVRCSWCWAGASGQQTLRGGDTCVTHRTRWTPRPQRRGPRVSTGSRTNEKCGRDQAASLPWPGGRGGGLWALRATADRGAACRGRGTLPDELREPGRNQGRPSCRDPGSGT